jgi:hypothetical protein
MSAEIIPIGTSKVLVRIKEGYEDRRKRKGVPAVVRFMFDGAAYEAEYEGDELRRLFLIHYRIHDDYGSGLKKMRRDAWRNSLPDDPGVLAAARRARASGALADDTPAKRVALAELRKRHAELVRQVERVAAVIASMEETIDDDTAV